MRSDLAALALVGVLLGSALVGTCMVLCAREHWSGMSARVRRFVRTQHYDASSLPPERVDRELDDATGVPSRARSVPGAGCSDQAECRETSDLDHV